MYHHQENDELKARFSIWLEKLVRNARVDYKRIYKKNPEPLYLADISEQDEPRTDDIILPVNNETFEFEEECLARAFEQLPLMRQRILSMLFIENIKPDEIAKRLNCSTRFVYNNRARALDKLKKFLSKGGDFK